MRKTIIIVFIILMVIVFSGCSTSYDRVAYNTIPRQDELIPENVVEVSFSYAGKGEQAEGSNYARFIADMFGEIYVNAFSLKTPGYMTVIMDSVTNVAVLSNSRATLVNYGEKFFLNGEEVDLFEQGKAIEFTVAATVDQNIYISLQFLEEIFGFETKFKTGNSENAVLMEFDYDVHILRKNSGGEVSNIASVPYTSPAEVVISAEANTIYTTIVDTSDSDRARYEVINRFADALVGEGFVILARPNDTSMLLVRNSAYVSIKSWTVKDVKVDYINCVPR